MVKSSIEKLSETIGFEIGTSDDIVQSNLINSLSLGIIQSMGNAEVEHQLCYIVKKLGPASHKVIKGLNEFILLKEQNDN